MAILVQETCLARLIPVNPVKWTPKAFSGGFTLVELLVVISIIALLVSILLPALNKARGQAKAIVCATQMRQYTMAVVYYVDDNDYFFPRYASIRNYTTDTPSDTHHEDVWINSIAPYMDGEKISPGAPQAEKDAVHFKNWEMEVRDCPEKNSFIGIVYGAFAGAKVDAPWLVVGPGPGNNGFKSDAIRGPSEWISFVDVNGNEEPRREGWGMYSPNYQAFNYDYNDDGIDDSYGAHVPSGYPYNYARPEVHNNAMNIGLCDGHVERMSFNEFQNPNNTLWNGRPGI
jgi:prepilin-type N-terminal cleavage/methylation domain-containing protein/prepilin-type processing-associated H-X9-DG protein